MISSQNFKPLVAVQPGLIVPELVGKAKREVFSWQDSYVMEVQCNFLILVGPLWQNLRNDDTRLDI